MTNGGEDFSRKKKIRSFVGTYLYLLRTNVNPEKIKNVLALSQLYFNVFLCVRSLPYCSINSFYIRILN